MDIREAVMKEVTDDYVAAWEADPNPKSIFFRLAMVCLPEGVDPNDPRVKAIIEKVRKANPEGF